MSNGSSPSAMPMIVGGVVLLAVAGVAAFMAFRPAPAPELPGGLDPAKLPGDSVAGIQPVKTPTGLTYYDIRPGDGASPRTPTSTVTVTYTGWLTDGTKFDSSFDHGGTSQFPLDKVIAGWREGVSSMKVGAKRKLVVPSKLGYKERGSPPTIPPNATLVFDIELVNVTD